MESGAAVAREPLHQPDAQGHIIVVVAHLSRSGRSPRSSLSHRQLARAEEELGSQVEAADHVPDDVRGGCLAAES